MHSQIKHLHTQSLHERDHKILAHTQTLFAHDTKLLPTQVLLRHDTELDTQTGGVNASLCVCGTISLAMEKLSYCRMTHKPFHTGTLLASVVLVRTHLLRCTKPVWGGGE